MISTERHHYIFQQEWTGRGERGMRDFLLIPAIFFGAVSPGLYLSSLVFGYLPGCWAALVLNLFGYGLTHLLFLGRMERFWRAMTNWRTSWISRGFLFNAFFSFFGLSYVLSQSLPLPVPGVPGMVPVLKGLAALSAVLFAAYPGFMLSIVKAIPFWRSALEPVLFFLQGLLGGTALHIAILGAFPAGSQPGMAIIKLNAFLLFLVLALFGAALAMKRSHGGAERESVEYLTKSPFSPVFIHGAMLAGAALPLLIILGALLLHLDFTGYGLLYMFAMALELAGIYLAKYGMLKAGAYTPLAGK